MSIERFSLAGKVAIVTGGAGGCGEEYGRGLSAAGAQVVLADLDGERAEQHAKELRDQGREAIGVPVDITDPDAAGGDGAARHRRVRRRRHPDQQRRADERDPDGIDPHAPARLVGPGDEGQRDGRAVCTRAVVPSMLERGGGRIINQVSGGAFIPGGIYSISKLALVSLTTTLATELGPQGINVNAIAPGFVADEAGYESLGKDDPMRAAILAAVPGKKEGPPDDLVGTILLLASSAGDWINGQTISVDGGWIMRV